MGWTQQELAERANVSVRTVREVERGRAGRRGAASARIAELLGLDAGDSGLRIGVLGPLVVLVEDVPVEVRAQMQRSLLGLLALHAGDVVSTDRIVDALWADHPPATWRNLVHTYVTRLRKTLSSNAIVNAPGGYRLSADEVRFDVTDFDAHTAAARRLTDSGDLAPAERELRAALELWRGPVLDDLPDRVRASPVTAAITTRRTEAALAHADVALARSLYREAVTCLRPVADHEPLHEPLHARLIVALAGSGQVAAALELFGRIRARLADELGVRPSPELRDAHVRVLRQDDRCFIA